MLLNERETRWLHEAAEIAAKKAVLDFKASYAEPDTILNLHETAYLESRISDRMVELVDDFIEDIKYRII